MQNALNTVGPVDQAKRSVLQSLVSHKQWFLDLKVNLVI